MSLETILSIKKAEKEAEEITKLAAQQAKDIIAQAQAQAHASVSNAVEQFGLEKAQIIKNAEDKAQKEADKIKSDIKNQCSKLKEDASVNINKAIDFVAGKIGNTE